MALFIIFLIILLGAIGCASYFLTTTFKNKVMKPNYKDLLFKLGYIGIAIAISFPLMALGATLMAKYPLNNFEVFQLLIGGGLLSLLLYIFIICFIIHYYGKYVPEKLDKVMHKIICFSWPVLVILFFVFTNGFGDHLKYPLVNSLSFSSGWLTPLDGKGNIAFYAICILTGALFVYFLCDHKMYKEYGQHGLLESTFLIAFPSGIIGARIGFCVDHNVPLNEWLNIQAGGLTILTGAITGIVVGALWFRYRRSQYNIWVVVDIIIPTILIAQTMGRWGNFFNVEVHGIPMDETSWRWLPSIIYNNAHYGVVGSSLGQTLTGQIYVPLFFFEGIVNIVGYYVLSTVFGKWLRKYTELGDICLGYLIWYGGTRLFMEPLRDSVDQMVSGGVYTGWVSSIVMILLGALLIALNHIIRNLIRKHNKEDINDVTYLRGTLALIINTLVLIIFAVIGGILMADGFEAYSSFATLTLNTYVLGICFIVLAGCAAITYLITIPVFLEGIKQRKIEGEK